MLNFLRIKSAALTCITLSLLLSCLYFLSTIHTSPISAAICSLWDRSRSAKNAKHCASKLCVWGIPLVGRAKRAHLLVQLARIFSSHRVVSPDTVSLLNVSTRFYLGVHAVRNIATHWVAPARPQCSNSFPVRSHAHNL